MERGLHYPLRGSQIGVPAGASTDSHRRQGTRARVTSCAAAISAEQPRADSIKARLSGATAINTKEARADSNKARAASRDAASLSAGEARADINKNARRPPRRRLTQRGRGPRQHKQKQASPAATPPRSARGRPVPTATKRASPVATPPTSASRDRASTKQRGRYQPDGRQQGRR